MSTEQQPEAPAFTPPIDCDAAEWGGAATVYGGRCRCIVCARCGHHVANSAQGHHWDWCTVTRSMRVPHFCCPDPAFGCELEAPAPEPLIMAADEFAATRKVAEALTAVGRGLELAAPFHDADRQIIAAARQALRVLGGEEADAGPAAASTDAKEGPWTESPGVALIAVERSRQVTAEGYTPGHDAEHDGGELAEAAVAYALAANGDGAYREFWPFRPVAFKPVSPVRALTKAGALIAAELDRLVAKGANHG